MTTDRHTESVPFMGSRGPTGPADLCHQFHSNHVIYRAKLLLLPTSFFIVKCVKLLHSWTSEKLNLLIMVTINTSVLMKMGGGRVGEGWLRPAQVPSAKTAFTHTLNPVSRLRAHAPNVEVFLNSYPVS